MVKLLLTRRIPSRKIIRKSPQPIIDDKPLINVQKIQQLEQRSLITPTKQLKIQAKVQGTKINCKTNRVRTKIILI